jgi:hypothetical protein
MKKFPTISIFLALICVVMFMFSSCATNTPGASQPVPTVTVISTVVVTSVATVTVTPTATSASTSYSPIQPTTTRPISSSPTPTVPVEDNNNVNNNPLFFTGKDITGYNKIPQSDGSSIQTPVYQEKVVEQQLGGFFTKKDAVFVPRIPTVTDIDDWFIRFDSKFKIPWFINWGYTTKNSNSKNNITLKLYTKDDFDTYYYKNPAFLISGGIGTDQGITDKGIHGLSVPTSGSFVAVIRTNNSDEIQDWWIKFGGQN